MWSDTLMMSNPISSPRLANAAMSWGVAIGPRLGTLKPYSILGPFPYLLPRSH